LERIMSALETDEKKQLYEISKKLGRFAAEALEEKAP